MPLCSSTGCPRVARRGLKTCAKCGERTNAWRLAHKTQVNDYRRKRIRDARNRGLCSYCLRRKARPGKTTCKPCGKGRSDYATRRRNGQGKCQRCGEQRKPGSVMCEIHLAQRRAEHRALKVEVMEAYGGRCTCCDEREIEFLTIDHMNNDGAAHRRALARDWKSRSAKGGGVHFYRWLKKHGFPSGYQVLCSNCNISKHLGDGVCAHKRKAKS